MYLIVNLYLLFYFQYNNKFLPLHTNIVDGVYMKINSEIES